MAKIPGGIEIFTDKGDPVNIRNTMLLDYLLWDFSWNFESAVIDERIETSFPKFKERPELGFKIEKISSTEFRLELKRSSVDEDAPADDGYFLEFIITVFGYNGPLKRRIMDFENDAVSVVYDFRDLCEMQKESGYWILKCIIKLHEISSLQNDARSKQEELILNLANEDKYREKIADMAFVLGRVSFKDIFSGRQEYEFAVEKAGLIERTLIFADVIADKMRGKERGNEHETSTPLGDYLHYILDKSSKCIDKYSALKLYIMAHHYGLSYLADECTEFMLANIDNDYVVYVLVYADMAQDLNLMNTALGVFIANRDEVMQTTAWENLSENSRLFAQNIIDASIRKVRYEIKHDLTLLTDSQEENEDGDEAQVAENLEENAGQNASENSNNVNGKVKSEKKGTKDDSLKKNPAAA